MSKILFSSISKKFVMALAGLFLLTFLPLHFIINLMLLKSEPGLLIRQHILWQLFH